MDCSGSDVSGETGILGNCMGLICKAGCWMMLDLERSAQQTAETTQGEYVHSESEAQAVQRPNRKKTCLIKMLPCCLFNGNTLL